MAVHPSTRSHLDDHLGQAEFALTVVANFACLKGTPAHESVRAALARVAEARAWVGASLAVERPVMKPAIFGSLSVAEQERVVTRRMARLAP